MKFSFTGKGWERLSFEESLNLAKTCEFSGFEPYIKKPAEFPEKDSPLDKRGASATRRRLKELRLSLPAIDTDLDISAADADIEGLCRILAAAKDTGIPAVAVAAAGEEEENVRKNIEKLLPAAEKHSVAILIKTCGIYGNTAKLRELLDSFASDFLAALWIPHYPYRVCGEEPDATIRNLGAYVAHVHLFDSEDADNFALVGEGSLPIGDVMNALSSINYDGFISLEWMPEWMEELSDESVIFPHFINYMNRFADTRGKKKRLYPNFDGSGEYIWKKDELISLSFPQVLDRVAEEFPDQYAFKYTTLDYTRTYSQFRDDVNDFARTLVALGVGPGKKVAVWAANVPAWFITFWAAVKIGAVLVSVNTAYKIHELEYLMRQSDTHTLVMTEGNLDTNYAEIINQLCPEIASSKPGRPLKCKKLPFLRNVITAGFSMPGCLTFDEAMHRKDRVSVEEINRMAADVRPGDVCNMQYTSGTTGFPKGVMLTHYNVINNGKCIGDRLGLSTADRMMIQVPMFHCFGMVLSMTAIMTHGGTACPLPYFSAKASLACINQEKITCFNGVPTMFIAMFNHPNYRKTDFSYMRTGIMAGSGCPPELMRRAARPDEMNMRGIVSVYGQTECAPGNTMTEWTDPLDMRCDTVGYAFPHILCKVIDPATGKELADGEDGEFCSKGYNTMKGYYKMPLATGQTIDEDGWLHSGDLARRAPDGTYRITGRLKDMIIRGGENIYPKEIEEFIYTHPKVQDVQVIGVPDKRYGEEALACIILKDGETLTEPEMRAYIEASLARHKVPRYIEFTDSFPMNAAGKVLKYKMREDAVKRLGLG